MFLVGRSKSLSSSTTLSSSALSSFSVVKLVVALFACTFLIVIDIEHVTCMSLDRLGIDRNEIQNEKQERINVNTDMVVDDMELEAVPAVGNTELYVLVPAGSASEQESVNKNTIENAEGQELEAVSAGENESDMLMMETNDEPAMQVVAMPVQMQSEQKQSEELSLKETELENQQVNQKQSEELSLLEAELENQQAAAETSLEDGIANAETLAMAQSVTDTVEVPVITDKIEIIPNEMVQAIAADTQSVASELETAALTETDQDLAPIAASSSNESETNEESETIAEAIVDAVEQVEKEVATELVTADDKTDNTNSEATDENNAKEETPSVETVEMEEDKNVTNEEEDKKIIEDLAAEDIKATDVETNPVESLIKFDDMLTDESVVNEVQVELEDEEAKEQTAQVTPVQMEITPEVEIMQNDKENVEQNGAVETEKNEKLDQSVNVNEEATEQQVAEQAEETETLMDTPVNSEVQQDVVAFVEEAHEEIPAPVDNKQNLNTESAVQEEQIMHEHKDVVSEEETQSEQQNAEQEQQNTIEESIQQEQSIAEDASKIEEAFENTEQQQTMELVADNQAAETTAMLATQDEQQMPQEEMLEEQEIETQKVEEPVDSLKEEQPQQQSELIITETIPEPQPLEVVEQVQVDAAEETQPEHATNEAEPDVTATLVNSENLNEPLDEQVPVVEIQVETAESNEDKHETIAKDELVNTETVEPAHEIVEIAPQTSIQQEAEEQEQSNTLLTTIVQVPQQQLDEQATEQQLPQQEQIVQSVAVEEHTPTKLETTSAEIINTPVDALLPPPADLTTSSASKPTSQASIESTTLKPLNVVDSVLNYVNASFMQQNNNNNKPLSIEQDNEMFSSELRRYDGAQLWRIVVQNDRDKKLADELQTKYDGQLWKEVKQEVDYLLKPQVLAEAAQHIRAANLSRIVLIDNLQSVIEVENPSADEIAHLQNRKGHRLTWQAYHRLSDIHGFFDYLAKTYPDICTVETIGYSVQKRPLKILKISNGKAGNPGFWIDGGMHAREWISPSSVTYIANQIVEGWDDLPAHMRNVNWYIHAVANPDGYEYSHTTDRLWRKNMRSHGRQCPGVDLNRNFGYKWGGKGTSANPCAQTYRGSKAFSEPETFYISKFISNFPRDTFHAYVSFHSYGQYILYPWGFDYQLTNDRADLDRIARQAGTIITKSSGVKYTVGSSATTLYPAAGGSDDWAKGFAGIKYAYTIEMGDTGRYGFVLPASFIERNGKDGYTFVETIARAITKSKDSRKRRH